MVRGSKNVWGGGLRHSNAVLSQVPVDVCLLPTNSTTCRESMTGAAKCTYTVSHVRVLFLALKDIYCKTCAYSSVRHSGCVELCFLATHGNA